MRRCEDEKMWRWEDVKMRRCEDEKMWRWEDVKMRRCEDEKMWRWEGVKMKRCEDEKMKRCEDEKVWRWENLKMRKWENVKMKRCDEKVWWQTSTIRKTLRSDALGNNTNNFVFLCNFCCSYNTWMWRHHRTNRKQFQKIIATINIAENKNEKTWTTRCKTNDTRVLFPRHSFSNASFGSIFLVLLVCLQPYFC